MALIFLREGGREIERETISVYFRIFILWILWPNVGESDNSFINTIRNKPKLLWVIIMSKDGKSNSWKIEVGQYLPHF